MFDEFEEVAECECEWCGEPYDESDLAHTDYGYICNRCVSAILSRGEPITIYRN